MIIKETSNPVCVLHMVLLISITASVILAGVIQKGDYGLWLSTLHIKDNNVTVVFDTSTRTVKKLNLKRVTSTFAIKAHKKTVT